MNSPRKNKDPGPLGQFARYAFAPLRLLYKLWVGLVFFLSLLVLYIPFRILLYTENRYQKAFILKRYWSWFLSVFMGMPVHKKFLAELPEPPYIVCSNHSSYIDTALMYRVVPDYFLFMGKYELLKWPLFNIFFKDMNIAVNRSSHIEAHKAFLKAAQRIDDGACLAIFPEGTISPNVPEMLRFKNGAFKLAVDKQVPIVPVTFKNNYKLFGDPETLLSRGRPGISNAVIHPHIETKGMTEDDLVSLRAQVFEVINSALPNGNR